MMQRSGCCRHDHPRIGRRNLLQVGGLGLLGMGLSDLLRLQSEGSAEPLRKARAKSVVFIFQSGGPSQHETFDPKPEAPMESEANMALLRRRSPAFTSASTCRA